MKHPIPKDSIGATPYLVVRGAAEALGFYQRAFGAVEAFRIDDPSGRVGHAEAAIGRARFMLSDEWPELGIVGPKTLGGSAVMIHVYVEDVDALVARAVEAGATLHRAARDQFYGDREAQLVDPFGHRWSFATRFEDVTPEEMKRRAASLGAE
jgi:PhnB protein